MKKCKYNPNRRLFLKNAAIVTAGIPLLGSKAYAMLANRMMMGAAGVEEVYTDPPSWDLLDEDCAGIGDWTSGDTGTGVSEVSPAGQFRLDSNANTGSYAYIWRDIGEIPDVFTAEIKWYHDAIGAQGTGDQVNFIIQQADEQVLSYFGSNGMFIQETDDGVQEVGTDLVQIGAWQVWRFVVTFGSFGDGTCNVWLTDSAYPVPTKVGSNVTCSQEGAGTDGKVELWQMGDATADRVSHVDYVKIATGAYP